MVPLQEGLGYLRRRLIGLALTLAVAACTLGVLPLPLVGTLDNAIYDGRLRMHAARIARVGRWPWERAGIGELAASLIERGGARVVGLDLVFAEPRHAADSDAPLASRLTGLPVVFGYYFTADRGGRTSGDLPPPVMTREALSDLDIRSVTRWDGFGANLATLRDHPAGAGFFNPLIDSDGTVRALPLLGEFRGALYESFALAVLRHWLGAARLRLDADTLSLHGDRGVVRMPLSDDLSALVPFAGRILGDAPGAARFEVISAADILEGQVDWHRFRDRIVLIGSSAPGLADLRATPVQAAMPGVAIHATLIAAALDSVDASPAAGALLQSRSSASAGLGALVALGTGVVLTLMMPVLGALGSLTLGAVAALTIWGSAAIAWNNLGLVIPVAAAQGLVVALLILNLTAGYFVEGPHAPRDGRSLRRVCLARARRASGARSFADCALGQREPRADDPLRRYPRIHPDRGDHATREPSRVPERLSHGDDRGGASPWRHGRQVHRRCGDGLLGRAVA